MSRVPTLIAAYTQAAEQDNKEAAQDAIVAMLAYGLQLLEKLILSRGGEDG